MQASRELIHCGPTRRCPSTALTVWGVAPSIRWRSTQVRMHDTLAERLAAKTVKSDGCWTWTGAKYPDGYGQVWDVISHKHVYTHRLAWEIASGTVIPKGGVIGHICDEPSCVRNDAQGVYSVRGVLLPRWGHLFLGTKQDNIADRDAKGRTRGGGLKGEELALAKLTDDLVLEIRSKVLTGKYSQRELARFYGVNQSQISRLLSRKTWSHV